MTKKIVFPLLLALIIAGCNSIKNHDHASESDPHSLEEGHEHEPAESGRHGGLDGLGRKLGQHDAVAEKLDRVARRRGDQRQRDTEDLAVAGSFDGVVHRVVRAS